MSTNVILPDSMDIHWNDGGGRTEGEEMSDCPFCSRDPFHYVDNGIGMEAVAVTCCELGDLFFRGARPAPEEVTLSWDEFSDLGFKLSVSQAAERSAKLLCEEYAAKITAMEAEIAEASERGNRYHDENDALFKRAVAAETRLFAAMEVIKPFALLCKLDVKGNDSDLTSIYPMVAAGRLRAARDFLEYTA